MAVELGTFASIARLRGDRGASGPTATLPQKPTLTYVVPAVSG